MASSARWSRCALGLHRRVVAGAFDPWFQEKFSPWPSRLHLAVRLVVLVAVGDEVGEGEAVVGGEEVDAAGRGRREDVARSGERGRERADGMRVAAPEAAHACRGSGRSTRARARGSARAGSRPGRCPRARRSAPASRASGSAAISRRSGASRVEARRAAPEHGGEVEAEAVDAGLADEVAQRVEHQPPGGGVVAGERVAGPGVVDQPPVAARGGSRRGRRGRAGERVGPPASPSPVWLKTTSRITPMPASRRAATVAAQLGDAAGAEPRVGREEGDRVVAPGVGQQERRQVALVDPGGDRHQLDRVDPEPGRGGRSPPDAPAPRRCRAAPRAPPGGAG